MGLGTLALVVAGVFATKANKNGKFTNNVPFYTYTAATSTYTLIIQSSCTTTPFTSGTGISTAATLNGKPVYYSDGLSFTRANFVF